MNAIKQSDQMLRGGYRTVVNSMMKSGRPGAGRMPRLIPAYEAVAGIAMILVLGAILPDQGVGLLNMQPHPFWIIVLVIAVRYGAFAGAFAGGLSAITYSLLLGFRDGAGFQLSDPRELILPLLMFVVGLVLGELVDGREQRTADLQARLEMAETGLQALWRKFRAAEESSRTLEKQIAFEANSTLTLSAWGRQLQSLSEDDLHVAIVRLVSELLEAKVCALYLADEAHLLLQTAIPEDRRGRRQMLDLDDPLIRMAVEERRVVSIHDVFTQPDRRLARDSDQDGLIAGPLLLSDGQLYGVVIIESLPFDGFTPSNVERFGLILGWASGAIENALRYEQARQNAYQPLLQTEGLLKHPVWDTDLPVPG